MRERIVNACMGIILQKRYWRSDTVWTTSIAFNSPLKFIPFWLDRFSLSRSQYWSARQLEELRIRRLRRLIQEASKLPFWSDLFRRAGITADKLMLENFERIPSTSRKDFREREQEEYIVLSRKNISFTDRTSGSTGSPFHFYVDRGAVLRSFGVRDRVFRAVGNGTRYEVIPLRALKRIGMAFYKVYFFYLRGSYSIRHRLPDLAKLVNTDFSEGVVLYAIGSWILALAREVERTGIRFPIRAIVSAGEAMHPAERDYVERTLQTRLFLAYASQEGHCMAFECEHKRLHINEEEIYIEIVDETGKSLPIGTPGKVLITPLDNRVMPFIRYENGDIGSISDEPCKCGRTLRTITVIGREKDIIKLPDNREVALIDLAPVFDSFFDTVRQYQIVQKSLTNFLIRAVVTDYFVYRKEELTSRLVRTLHPTVAISWEIVQEIPNSESGKALYFVREYVTRT